MTHQPDQPKPLDAIDQLAVIGTGLLGTSVGLALKARGFAGRIVGVARRTETAEAARETGGIDATATDLEAAIRQSQLALLAVPLGAFDATLARLAPLAHDQLVLTDVGSTKASVLDAAARHLPDAARRRFVGAHPMAGSEQQGPAAACADLFDAKPCILTPETDTDPAALALVESLWTTIGMRLLRMTVAEHDRAVATVSHLPHAVAALLVQVAIQEGGWDVASTGFRDTTRLASSNPPMRADILAANRGAVIEAIAAMRGQLDRFAELLHKGEDAAVLALLERSREARDQWLNERRNADP